MADMADLSLLADRGAENAPDPPRVQATIPAPGRKWKTRVLLPGVLFLSAAGLLAYAAGDVLWPSADVRVVPVLVKSGVGGQASGTVTVQAPGWVEPDPFSIDVSALASGVVAEVLVLEGHPVEAGQVVARLVPDDARLALEQAEAMKLQREAELLAAEARLVEAKQDWDNPIELTRKLETAEARLAEKRAELDRWPAELAREAAREVYAAAEYERVRPLYESGQASRIEMIQSQQAYEAQRATVEAMRRLKPIIEAQIAMLEAEARAAREDLRLRIRDQRVLAEARANLAQAQAALDAAAAARAEAALRLDRMEVRSPAAGIVMTRLSEPGSKLMLDADNPRSAQVVRIYDPQKLQVRVDIPLVDAAKVGVGQRAEVVVDVLPDRVYHGHVARVVHEADVQKNTLQVKVAIEDPTPEIKPEMLARARFLASSDPAASAPADAERVFVPESYMHGGGAERWVWLADQTRNVALRRNVVVGRTRLDRWIEITDGLHAGDRVIADAPESLRTGARIRIVGEADVH